jgi:plastocyanin
MAGRLNLAATGIQDQWFTGEPEFSYFLMNFRRHTKFSIEAVETPFDGEIDYDTIIECRIPKNKGDLIRSTMLKFTLPKPTTPDKSFTVTAAGGKYFIDGDEQATLTLYEGTTYTFNVNASSHPFRFSTAASPNYSDYITGVTNPGTPTVTFTPTSTTPSILYYYCAQHSGMGGQINVKSLRYRESIGAQIIDHADLVIGGQTIERITGDYIYMYDQIHSNKDDIDQTLYFLTGHGNYIDVEYDWDYSLFLPFYFFRNPSLAIPVCALTKQLVEVRIKFKKLEDVTVSHHGDSYHGHSHGGTISEPPSVVSSSIKEVSLVTDFFFITDDEKNFLLTRPIEYVITQLQMSQFKFKPGESKKSGMLNFKNPIKEMFFMAESEDVHKLCPIKNVIMKFNNNTIIDADNLMLSYEQPLKYYTGITGNDFGVYSFSMKPETYYPTGQVNMSRIAHNLIEIDLESPDVNFAHNVKVYAVNYNVLRINSGLAGLKF